MEGAGENREESTCSGDLKLATDKEGRKVLLMSLCVRRELWYEIFKEVLHTNMQLY